MDTMYRNMNWIKHLWEEKERSVCSNRILHLQISGSCGQLSKWYGSISLLKFSNHFRVLYDTQHSSHDFYHVSINTQYRKLTKLTKVLWHWFVSFNFVHISSLYIDAQMNIQWRYMLKWNTFYKFVKKIHWRKQDIFFYFRNK